MPIIAENNGAKRELIPAGNYIARCYKMLQIGTVTENIMGTEKRLHKVRIGWELPNETRVFKEENGPQPLVIDKEYTLSMNEKANLRIDLKSWRGRDFTDDEAKAFDITKLVGAACMLNIIHHTAKNGNVYEQISGITPLPKGIVCPDPVNGRQVLSFDVFDFDLFTSLPDFIKDKIQSSEEFKAMQNPHPVDASDNGPGSDDDLPF